MDESNTFCVYFSMASGYTVLKMKDFIKSCSDSSSFREGVLRTFAKFTRKQLCQSLFLNEVAVLRIFISKNKSFPMERKSVNFE